MERVEKRMYFTSEDDLHLLREVVGQNPYEDSNRWNVIQINITQIVGKFISVRTLKDRVRSLVNKFREKDRTLQFQSGIEEEVSELDDLLRYIAGLIDEFKNKKNKKPLDESPNKMSKKRKNDSSYQKGLMQRAVATEACTVQLECTATQACSSANASLDNIYNEVEITTETNNEENDLPLAADVNKENEGRAKPLRNILTPARKRASNSIKQNTLAYLTKKNDRWYEIRSRELTLQEREKSLQEKKFELEAWERKKSFEMQEKKNAIELDILKNQQRLIEIAFQKS